MQGKRAAAPLPRTPIPRYHQTDLKGEHLPERTLYPFPFFRLILGLENAGQGLPGGQL